MQQSLDKSKITTLLYSFLLPILLILPAFAAVGIFPFGDKSLLIVDMHNEYIDYLAAMHNAVRSSASLLRSWNMGMGLNMLGLIAFYTASPFNIIALLMPLSMITEAVFAITLLKLGCAGLLFAIFARDTFPDVDKTFHIIFAVAYALASYNIAYSSNIMWLDGSAFLPLVMLGVERILKVGRCKTFLISLVYIFLTSYYIGYMIGIFAFLYFTARYFTGESSFKRYMKLLTKFLGSAILAAGCCSFLLLPAFLNLKNGQSEMWNIPFEMRLRFPLVRMAAKLVPTVYDSLTDSGLPNIYCTVLALSLCFVYFCTKAVPRREKYVFGGFFGFILLSFSCEILNLAWHAFEVPTWFPARYSFVFSFLVLYLALRCVSVAEQISRREIVAASVLLFLLFVEVAVNRFRFVQLREILLGLLLVVIYAVLFSLWNIKDRRSLSAALIILVCMESFANAGFMVLGMENQFGYQSRSVYRDFMESYGAAVERVKQLDSGVYRTEIVEPRGANGSMALGYNGISHYSTTTDQSLNKFLRQMGYNKGTDNELRFSTSTPITNGLMGIKYVLAKKSLGEAFKLIEDVGDVGIYENTSTFPLAFWSPNTAIDFIPKPESSAFELQNDFLSALMGAKTSAFIPIKPQESTLSNVEKIIHTDHIEYARQIRNQSAELTFEVENPYGSEAYAFFPVYAEKFSSSEIIVNDVPLGRDLAYRSNTIIPLGNETESTLKIIVGGDRIRVAAEYFAVLNLDVAQKAAAQAAENQMIFTKFNDTDVEGKITAPNDGLLATTFPYDSGWSVEIDGKKVDTTRLAGVFLAVPITEGEHNISMRYLPPGFAAGFVISGVTLACICVWYFLKRKNGRSQ